MSSSSDLSPSWKEEYDLYYDVPWTSTPTEIRLIRFRQWEGLTSLLWKDRVRWHHPCLSCVLRSSWWNMIPFSSSSTSSFRIVSVWNEWARWKDQIPLVSPERWIEQSTFFSTFSTTAWIESFFYFLSTESSFSEKSPREWLDSWNSSFGSLSAFRQYLGSSSSTEWVSWKSMGEAQQRKYIQWQGRMYIPLCTWMKSIEENPFTPFVFEGKSTVQSATYVDTRSWMQIFHDLQWNASHTYPYVLVFCPEIKQWCIHPRAMGLVTILRKEWENKWEEMSKRGMTIVAFPFSMWTSDLTSSFLVQGSSSSPSTLLESSSLYHISDMEYQQASYFSPSWKWIHLFKTTEDPDKMTILLESEEQRVDDSFFQFLHLPCLTQEMVKGEKEEEKTEKEMQILWTDVGKKGISVCTTFQKDWFLTNKILPYWSTIWKMATLQSTTRACWQLWDQPSSKESSSSSSSSIHWVFLPTIRQEWKLDMSYMGPHVSLQLPTVWSQQQEYELVYHVPLKDNERQACEVWFSILYRECQTSLSMWMEELVQLYPPWGELWKTMKKNISSLEAGTTTTEEKDMDKKRKDLTVLFPQLFPKNFYKTHCQGEEMQPILLDEAEISSTPMNEKLQFPDQVYDGVEPQWYGCPQGSIYKYPGLKAHKKKDLLFRYVPCCYKRPQIEHNKEKMKHILTEDGGEGHQKEEEDEEEGGIAVFSTKVKENIITLSHLIHHQGQLGKLPMSLDQWLRWYDPAYRYFRMGCPFPSFRTPMIFEYHDLLRRPGKLQMKSVDQVIFNLRQYVESQSWEIWQPFFPYFSISQIQVLWKQYWKQEIELPLPCLLYALSWLYEVQPFVFYRDLRKEEQLHIFSFTQASYRPQWSVLTPPSTSWTTLVLYAHHGGRMDILASTQHMPLLEIVLRQPLLEKTRYFDFPASFSQTFLTPWSFYVEQRLSSPPPSLVPKLSSLPPLFSFLVAVEMDERGHLSVLHFRHENWTWNAQCPAGVMGSLFPQVLSSVEILPLSSSLPTIHMEEENRDHVSWLWSIFFPLFSSWKRLVLWEKMSFFTVFDPSFSMDLTFCFVQTQKPFPLLPMSSSFFHSPRFRVAHDPTTLPFSWRRWFFSSHSPSSLLWSDWRRDMIVQHSWKEILLWHFSKYLQEDSGVTSATAWQMMSSSDALRWMDQFEHDFLSVHTKTKSIQQAEEDEWIRIWKPQWEVEEWERSCALWKKEKGKFVLSSWEVWKAIRYSIEWCRRYEPHEVWYKYSPLRNVLHFSFPFWSLWTLSISTWGSTNCIEMQSTWDISRFMSGSQEHGWKTSHLHQQSLQMQPEIPSALRVLSYSPSTTTPSSTIHHFCWTHPEENPFYPYWCRVFLLPQKQDIFPFFTFVQNHSRVPLPEEYRSLLPIEESSSPPRQWDKKKYGSLSYPQRLDISWFAPFPGHPSHVFVFLFPSFLRRLT